MKKPKHYISRGAIYAIQFTGENQESITNFLEDSALSAIWTKDKTELHILSRVSGDKPMTLHVSDFLYSMGKYIGVECEQVFKEEYKAYTQKAGKLPV